ncbi:MAG: AAA family ATPase [Nitrospirae bacterium]|nr:AAA family ATPase [Nitrospirota bacterium]
MNLEQAENRKLLKVVSIEQLLSLEIPPRDNILTPIITSQSISMLYGIRGVGKTHFVIGIALAVSGGGCFLKWRAEKPYNVLYIDGEMPAVVVQERFSRHIVSLDYEITGSLNIITPDLQKYGMPNLSTVDGQAAIEQHLDNVKLVILDNLSTLCRSGKENEGESWLPVQEWALRLRSKGISILFIHHAGKAGLQRGTSRREDVLDTVINLRRPADYHPSEGAKFEIHFEKARGLYGDDVKPFEAMLTEKDGRLLWTYKDVEESLTEKVAHLFNEGFKPGEIAEELNIRSKGTVSKHRKKALARGLIKDANDVQCKKFPVSHI